MVMLEIAIGMVLWSVYSSIRRSRIKRTIFTTMQILSELRDPYGERSNIPKLAANLPDYSGGDGNDDKDSSSSSWIRLAGDDSIAFEGSNKKNNTDITFKSTSNGWIVAYRDNGKDQNYALFGPKETTLEMPKLDKLVSTRTMMMEIVEDLDQRLAWEKEIASCQAIASSSSSSKKRTTTNTTTSATFNTFLGDYHFCYRDYVNHEELMGMMWKRWGIENFLFKPSRAGLVRIEVPPTTTAEDDKQKNPRCMLSERSKLFGVVPIAINWQGRLVEGSDDCSGATTSGDTTTDLRIVWDSTSLDLGWGKGFFGKHFDRPAMAEKLRQAPWVIKVKKEKKKEEEEEKKSDDNNETKGEELFSSNIVCFEKIGKGHLVFSKKECMSARAATAESGSIRSIVHSLGGSMKQVVRMLMSSGVSKKVRTN